MAQQQCWRFSCKQRQALLLPSSPGIFLVRPLLDLVFQAGHLSRGDTVDCFFIIISSPSAPSTSSKVDPPWATSAEAAITCAPSCSPSMASPVTNSDRRCNSDLRELMRATADLRPISDSFFANYGTLNCYILNCYMNLSCKSTTIIVILTIKQLRMTNL